MTEPEPTAGQPASPLAPPGIDTTVAHPARMLNYVLGASHPTQDFALVRGEQATQVGNRAGVPVWLRTRAEFTGFFAGLDVLEPGVVLVSDWRPEPGQERPDPHLVTCYGAVGRKPC